MGTNYYAVKRPTGTDFENLSIAIKTKPITEVISYLHDFEEEIHIGKSSGGWDFLFNYNKGKYYTNKLELLNWLETVYIKDEYGRPLTAGEFWKDVVCDRKWNGKPTLKHRSDARYVQDYMVIDEMEFLDSEFS